jgi:hypothetical protein
MSTQSPSTPKSTSIDLPDDADVETILEALSDASGVCAWCFERRHWYYPSDRRADLPERYVASSASREVVPPRTDERGQLVEPARPHTVCGCGVVDVDPTEDRTADELQTAVENIGARLAECGIPFSARPGRRHVAKRRDAGTLGGCDTEVLERAIELGRQHAELPE